MKCTQAKLLLSPYMDGAVTGTQMRMLGEHLELCESCRRECTALRRTQALLAQVGRKKAPADLSLQLRLAISREVAQSRGSRFSGLLVRMENAVNAFMVPLTAGLAAAVITFGVLIGSLATPLQADNADVPLMLYTAPQLQQSAFESGLDTIHDDSLVIEAYVDSNGRVQDYRILSNPAEAMPLLPQVKKMLIFTTFRPATSMGRPTAGRAVLSFSKISVKG